MIIELVPNTSESEIKVIASSSSYSMKEIKILLMILNDINVVKTAIGYNAQTKVDASIPYEHQSESLENEFEIAFDFDVEGDPPAVYIAYGSGRQLVKILEAPKCLTDAWSWEQDDWQEGPIAGALCDFMNTPEFKTGIARNIR